MKRILFLIIAIIFITLFIPLTIVMIMGKTIDNSIPEQSPESVLNMPDKVMVYNKREDKTAEMDTEEYIKGVVAAEMPADFEEEALKAQAVAARTYLCAKLAVYDGSETENAHHGAAVCTDPTHCQAWISEKDFLESHSKKQQKKIASAVSATEGKVITYNGSPISAVFFSASSGSTEAAVDVWGNDVPYLQSVASEGDELAPNYNSETVLTSEEFKKTAEENLTDIDWSYGLFGNIERSAAGGIKYIDIGSQRIKGTLFRSIYGLRSTNAELSEENGNVRISVTGFGHDVGMSQYGANYLASQGEGYEEILKRYYSGVEITDSK